MSATASPETREQLSQFRQRAAELRDQLKAQQDRVGRLRMEFAESGSQVTLTRVTEEVNKFDRLKGELGDIEAAERQMLGTLGDSLVGGAPSGSFKVDPTGPMADQLGNPEFADVMARMAHTSAHIGDVQIGAIPREHVAQWTGRSLAAGNGGLVVPTSGMSQGPFDRTVPLLQPPTTFLDLVGSVTMDYPSVPYAQEIPVPGGSGPAPTAPGAIKPGVDFAYQDAEANPATIAGWVKINRQTLADVLQLGAIIQNRLMFRTRQALEREVLSGDGSVSDRTGKPGIVGLLETTGIASLDQAADEMLPDALIDGITTLLVSGAQPNVIAMNPLDRAALLKTKSGGSIEYVANPFLATARTIWDVAFVPAVGVPPGKVIVGDTNVGLTLLIREPAAIRISDQDQDDFSRNRLTVLCELRAALAVWVPAAFCEVNLTA